MPIFLRKSLRAGPLRFNLSKSGIGVSAGIPGFRLGLVGPRGHYIYAGKGGVYYRATLPDGQPTSQPAGQGPGPNIPTQSTDLVFDEAPSSAMLELGDSQPAALVEQLNHVRSIPTVWKAAAAIGAIASLIALFTLWPLGLALAVVTLIGSSLLRSWDEARHAVIAFYDVQDAIAHDFEAMVTAFGWLSGSRQRFRTTAAAATSTLQAQKVNAGASVLVKDVPANASLEGPAELKSNIAIPSLEDRERGTYFLPERVLVREGGRFSSIPYSDLHVRVATVRWIETEAPAADSPVVDQTWRYVNKSGGPDRRFRDNRQLPILLHSELHLETPSGFRESYRFSHPEAAGNFAQGLAIMARPAV